MTENLPESLVRLGWDSIFNEKYQAMKVPGSIPCRIITSSRNIFQAHSQYGELSAAVSGRMRYAQESVYPAVGDWVAVTTGPDGQQGTIHAVIPRRSEFTRKAAGPRLDKQTVAANIDTVFLTSALDNSRNFNLRRLERYLTVAWQSGASPVIVLNKVDLCPVPEKYIMEAEQSAAGVPVHAVSATENIGMDYLKSYIPPGRTAAFIGPSGVGKSALINSLLGTERQATGEVREDDKRGRHTTTMRELIFLPGGGMVIDTPGIKELGIWGDEDDLAGVFDDIESLALECRFKDCSHDTEPGCAVKEALRIGELDSARFESYRKLQKELRFIASKEEYSLKLAEQARWKKISRLGKQLKKVGRKWEE